MGYLNFKGKQGPLKKPCDEENETPEMNQN